MTTFLIVQLILRAHRAAVVFFVSPRNTAIALSPSYAVMTPPSARMIFAVEYRKVLYISAEKVFLYRSTMSVEPARSAYRTVPSSLTASLPSNISSASGTFAPSRVLHVLEKIFVTSAAISSFSVIRLHLVLVATAALQFRTHQRPPCHH